MRVPGTPDVCTISGTHRSEGQPKALRFDEVETLIGWGLGVLLVGSLPASALWARRMRLRRERAEWQVAIRSTPGGTIVELVRPGEHAQRIVRLDPADEEFSTKLEDARYAAMERAVALNVARRGLTPGTR
jgi:hypothetical protein